MENLIKKIQDAGIVGCGGAGFPTDVKLNGKFETVIVNGAECEPLLHTDRYIMKNKAECIIKALEEVAKFVEAKEAVIALKKDYIEEIAALENAISTRQSFVRLHLMNSFYPTGDEQIIVNEVTGKIVPPAGIPMDVKTVVSNVTTMYSISQAIDGKPFNHRYLTVTGAVKTPMVICVPIGTSVMECIELAGGSTVSEFSVINGGPMMGKYLTQEEAKISVVTKTTSGLIVLEMDNALVKRHNISIKSTLKQARIACIQCSMCTDLCPRHLLGHPLEPHRIMRKLAYSDNSVDIVDSTDVREALLCSECGICEIVACPIGLQPRKVNASIKKILREMNVKYPKEELNLQVNTMKEYRNIPTKRAASRVGILKYYNNKVNAFEEYSPSEVEILLSQHIGAPAEPIVEVGSFVSLGQQVAKCPEGKLGANIHTGISGTVISVTKKSIVIKN